jgi:hypothetical protein
MWGRTRIVRFFLTHSLIWQKGCDLKESYAVSAVKKDIFIPIKAFINVDDSYQMSHTSQSIFTRNVHTFQGNSYDILNNYLLVTFPEDKFKGKYLLFGK